MDMPKQLAKLILNYLQNGLLDVLVKNGIITINEKTAMLAKIDNKIINVNYIINYTNQLIEIASTSIDRKVSEYIKRCNDPNQSEYYGRQHREMQHIYLRQFVDKIDKTQQQLRPLPADIEYKTILLPSTIDSANIVKNMANGITIYQLLKLLNLNTIKNGNLVSFMGKMEYQNIKTGKVNNYDHRYNLFFYRNSRSNLMYVSSGMLMIDFIKNYFDKTKSKYQIKKLYEPALDQEYEDISD